MVPNAEFGLVEGGGERKEEAPIVEERLARELAVGAKSREPVEGTFGAPVEPLDVRAAIVVFFKAPILPTVPADERATATRAPMDEAPAALAREDVAVPSGDAFLDDPAIALVFGGPLC